MSRVSTQYTYTPQYKSLTGIDSRHTVHIVFQSCVFCSDLASPEPSRQISRAKRRLLADSVTSPQPQNSAEKEDEVSLKTGKTFHNLVFSRKLIKMQSK